MHVNVFIYFPLELCHASIFLVMSTGIIFATDLGPVVVRGCRVYIKACFMQIYCEMILAGNA